MLKLLSFELFETTDSCVTNRVSSKPYKKPCSTPCSKHGSIFTRHGWICALTRDFTGRVSPQIQIALAYACLLMYGHMQQKGRATDLTSRSQDKLTFRVAMPIAPESVTPESIMPESISPELIASAWLPASARSL